MDIAIVVDFLGGVGRAQRSKLNLKCLNVKCYLQVQLRDPFSWLSGFGIPMPHMDPMCSKRAVPIFSKVTW